MDDLFRLLRYHGQMGRTGVNEESTLRADAERNRQRIIGAAQTLFAERGIDVTMEEVAKRAEVGAATLYRRFPTRADLVAGAFEEKMWRFADGARKALKDPDPWNGFCRYVRSLCAMQLDDRGFSDVLTMTFPSVARFEMARTQAFEDFSELTRRAQEAGSLRTDFVPEDLIILLMGSAGVVAATGDVAPRSAPRLVGYLLQAFAAPGGGALPPPPSTRQMYKAISRLDTARER
jgi:AcrR family transcriptional regulator